MEKNCLHCENIFTVINKNKRFCSERCQQNKWRKDNKERVLKTKKEYKEKNIDKWKKYHSKYYQDNKEKLLSKNKEYRLQNLDIIKEQNRLNSRKYYLNNIEYCKNYQKQWRENNPEKNRLKEANRRARKLQATPSWANMEKIKEIYLNCPKGYHVDHIIPLKGNTVCGLHVENNLQYLKATENIRKGNKFCQA